MGRGPTVAGFTSSVKKLCVSFVAMLALFVYRPGCSWAQESAVSNPQLRMQLGLPSQDPQVAPPRHLRRQVQKRLNASSAIQSKTKVSPRCRERRRRLIIGTNL